MNFDLSTTEITIAIAAGVVGARCYLALILVARAGAATGGCGSRSPPAS